MGDDNMEEMFHGFEVIRESNVDKYKCPGVWAMFGIKKESSSPIYICLNVGKNKCIGNELKLDFKRLDHFELFREKQYRNQFNEEMFSFTYKEYATRQDWLYKEISEKYKSITTILVAKQNDYIIEKHFAYSTKAAYWVSNGRYSSDRKIDQSEIINIRDNIDISKIELSLKEKIAILKEWYDNQ